MFLLHFVAHEFIVVTNFEKFLDFSNSDIQIVIFFSLKLTCF